MGEELAQHIKDGSEEEKYDKLEQGYGFPNEEAPREDDKKYADSYFDHHDYCLWEYLQNLYFLPFIRFIYKTKEVGDNCKRVEHEPQQHCEWLNVWVCFQMPDYLHQIQQHCRNAENRH